MALEAFEVGNRKIDDPAGVVVVGDQGHGPQTIDQEGSISDEKIKI